MKLTLLPDSIPDLLPMQDRSEGTHVSEIIRYLCIKLGHYETDDGKPIPLTRWQLGSTLEHTIALRYREHFPDRYTGGVELEKDGLFGTVDLIDTVEWAVDEIKLTWMSSRHEPTSKKYWKYWVQLMAYCWMLETSLGRLHVCNLNGDYSYDPDTGGPLYRKWEAVFTKRELEDNWNMLLKNRADVEKEKRAKGKRGTGRR